MATVLLGAFLTIGSSGVAFADSGPFHHHHHHHHHLSTYVAGTITGLGTNSVSVHRDNGQSATYATTSTTIYAFEGLGKTTFSDLAVGQKVDLSLTSSAPQAITKLVVELVKVEGTVTAVSGDTITLNGSPARIVTASTLTTFTLAGGAAATLSSVLVGDQIAAWGYYGATATSGLNADFVVIHPPVLPTYVLGTITGLGTNSVSVHRDNGQSATYATTSTTIYALEGLGKTTFSDLAVGQKVDLSLTSSAPQAITKLVVELVKVEGTVTAVSGDTITLNGSPARIVTASTLTTFTLAGGAAATLSSVLVGDQIAAWGYYGATATSGLNADFVVIHPPVLPTYVLGTITGLGTNSVSVHRDNGQSATYATTSTTIYALEGLGKTTFSDLAVGQKVDLSLTSSAPQAITKLVVELVKVEGTVTAVSGDTITLNGSPARIVTASTLTTFTLAGGAAATLSSVLVGDQIAAWGYYGATATSGLNADFVVIHPPVLPTYVLGTITGLGTNSVSVHRDNGQSATYATTSTTIYAFEGLGKTTFSDLAVGQKVDLSLTSSAPQAITKLVVELVKVEGTVTAVSGDTITLNGTVPRVVQVSSTTTFTLAGGAPATLASVLVGDQIAAWGWTTSPMVMSAINVRVGSLL